MLKKFISIRNVGTFRNSLTPGASELRKTTLVHAENGRGKTTLCAILRSLQRNEPVYVLERKTLDGDGVPHVKFLHDGALIEFKDGKWSNHLPHLEIFDAEFVANNVYSGDEITHDHKKNLCRVVLGEEGVKLAKQFDEWDAKVRSIGTSVTATKAEVQKLVPSLPGMNFERFLGLPLDAEVESKIAAKQEESRRVSDAEAILARPRLVPIVIPQTPANLSSTLQRTVEGLAEVSDSLIRQHIRQHQMEKSGEQWLAQGLQFVADDECPFCAQPLAESPLIKPLEAFFDGAYRRLKQELEGFKSSVDRALADSALLGIQKGVDSNAAQIEFWRRYVSADAPSISFDEQIEPAIRQLREAVKPLVERKLASPLESVAYSQELLTAIDGLEVLRTASDAYNTVVATFNADIDAVKAGLAGKNQASLQRELQHLEATKVRHQPSTVASVAAFETAKREKADAEQAKEAAKDALDKYNAKIIGAYHTAVNEILQRFGAAFRLHTVAVEYVGRTPRAGYTFEIRGKQIEPGGENTPVGEPCFRNTLSSGDRNTLALAFFIAQLKQRSDLSNLIVVFDDPFTSLDTTRQQWTCQSIRGIADLAKQVIVLSHSLTFLRLLSEKCEKATTVTLAIERHNAIDSQIVQLDLADATAELVERDVIKLRSYYMGSEKDASGAIRTIRGLLENHIRRQARDHCPPGDGWLGSFLGQIREADATSPLSVFKGDYETFSFLNGYTSPHAHDPTNAPDINEGELHAAAEQTLKLIGRL